MEEINEVADLMKFVKNFSQLPSEMIFRGQNEDWALHPSLFRTSKGSNLRIERELIKRLRLNKPILPSEIDDFYDFLIFAQQHSMPTRLLDWTYSPLIALWFACFNDDKDFSKDGIIYFTDSTSLKDARTNANIYNESVNKFKSHLDNISELQILIPSPLFERLNSQNGIFTVFPNLYNLDNLSVEKVLIPSSKKVSILKELGKLKINEFTIFRDHDSLCRTIYWETYSNKILHQDKEPPEFMDIIVS